MQRRSSRGRDWVLVTGASGFVGANLTRRLVKDGYRVTIITRCHSDLWRLEGVVGSIENVVADLTEGSQVKNALNKIKPTVIFHLATVSVYGGQPAPEPEMVRANLLGTINLIQACADVDYRCFVNTGSSSEYGPKTKPMVETDLTEPRDIYGVTKCAATHYASAVGKKESRPIVTLRLFSPFGPYDDPRRLIPTAVVSALTGRDIKLANPEIGRDYIYVDDVVEAFLSCIERARTIPGEIINVGSGRQKTLKETIETILSLIETPSRPLWGAVPGSSQDNPFWQADITKAKRCLDWTPQIDFQEGLRRTVEWFRGHLGRYAKSREH